MEPGVSLRSFGAFPTRGSGLRLAITGFRKAAGLAAYLERVGWPGQHEHVAAIISRHEARNAFACLGVHFDIQADGVGPMLGLSFYAREGQWLKDIRHWTPLLDGICEDGLAIAGKLSALADSWAGAQTLFGRTGPFVLVKGIHHIKLTVIGDRIEQGLCCKPFKSSEFGYELAPGFMSPDGFRAWTSLRITRKGPSQMPARSSGLRRLCRS